MIHPSTQTDDRAIRAAMIELDDLRAFRAQIVAAAALYRETQDKLRADAARYRFLCANPHLAGLLASPDRDALIDFHPSRLAGEPVNPSLHPPVSSVSVPVSENDE